MTAVELTCYIAPPAHTSLSVYDQQERTNKTYRKKGVNGKVAKSRKQKRPRAQGKRLSKSESISEAAHEKQTRLAVP